jgi:hypothetical protein
MGPQGEGPKPGVPAPRRGPSCPPGARVLTGTAIAAPPAGPRSPRATLQLPAPRMLMPLQR